MSAADERREHRRDTGTTPLSDACLAAIRFNQRYPERGRVMTGRRRDGSVVTVYLALPAWDEHGVPSCAVAYRRADIDRPDRRFVVALATLDEGHAVGLPDLPADPPANPPAATRDAPR